VKQRNFAGYYGNFADLTSGLVLQHCGKSQDFVVPLIGGVVIEPLCR
jgi:hypothetical protein